MSFYNNNVGMLPSFSLPALLILHVNLAALIHANNTFFQRSHYYATYFYP